jgi:hypothetical protein
VTELLLLAGVGILVALIWQAVKRLRGDGSSRSLQLDPPASVLPPIPPVSPRVEQVPANVFQPFSPIPLTIEGASHDAKASLRKIFEDERIYAGDRRERLLAWLLTTNVHIQEIDAFIAEWGPKFTATVKQLCESDPDWAAAGELDRDDIRDGAARKAIDRLEVRVTDLDYEVISEPPALVDTADDALLARYGFETLVFYFRNAEPLDRVHVVRSDDYFRPRFEALVAKGLAKRGGDVAPEGVLQTMTIKDMEGLAQGVDHKRFTRRAPAIEFLSTLPDLRERLGRHVSLRELFQLLPLPPEFSHLDLAALGHAWAYAAEYAKLLDITYSTAAQAHQTAAEATFDEYAKGWRVDSSFGDTPCCPFCAKQAGERRGARSAPRLPHHVGCSCHLSHLYG